MATSELTTANGFSYMGRSQDQPSLLPYNRKLRNLCSISLRNLVLPSQSVGHSHGKIIDDDADPKSFISPGKLKALREEKLLEHSHSSADLRYDDALAQREDEHEAEVGHDQLSGSPHKIRRNSTSLRSRPKRPRRRSTLEWMSAGSLQRQEKLQNVVEERMGNVFFSLHIEGLGEPIYISETVSRTMNPTFRSVDLSQCDNGILRQNKVIIRVWAQSLKSQQWHILSGTDVSFASLHYLGKHIESGQYASKQNTILFHFTDGIYAIATSVFLPKRSQVSTERDNNHRQRRTSSFDALLRLAKLTDSIEDALATRNILAGGLERMIQNNKLALDRRDQVSEVGDRLKTIDYAKSTVAKQLDKAKRQIQEKRALLKRRQTLMTADKHAQSKALDSMHSGRTELPHLRDEREIRKKAIAAQRRRIAEDVDKVYYIRPLQSGESLAFQIRGIPLPNAEELDSVPMATVAAALGYTAHAVLLLSFYLNITLPYPMSPMGSSSWISDPISLLNVSPGTSSGLPKTAAGSTDKIYPLHLNRTARFRFDYGVFLLNKNIQLLLETGFGVRVLDIRHTLPNLKYLLYVATAGEGDLPSRKAGGVRGLVRNAREPLSRASSSSSGTILSSGHFVRNDSRDSNKAAQSLRNLTGG